MSLESLDVNLEDLDNLYFSPPETPARREQAPSPDRDANLHPVLELLEELAGDIGFETKNILDNLETTKTHRSVTIENKREIKTSAKNIASIFDSYAAQMRTQIRNILLQTPTPTDQSSKGVQTDPDDNLQEQANNVVATVQAELDQIREEQRALSELVKTAISEKQSDCIEEIRRPTYSEQLRKPPTTKPKTNPALVATVETAKSTAEALGTFRQQISFKNQNFAPTKLKPLTATKIRIEFEINSSVTKHCSGLTTPPSKLSLPGPSRRWLF
ncbi:uncharacterized protein LOC133529150 [Cydia pomonella]|uniref:uncharacterized protein LOC133529150 n=1 Tax=Cydia pomonella TaxID=82600 RepID=UPI002ADD7E82|nr:uncharacterized protein LOC133529150 [Cydia pomonella]